MKYVQKDNDGNIIAVSNTQYDGFEASEVDYEIGFDGKVYTLNEIQSADYISRKNIFDNNKRLSDIRLQRETDCFPIINRGALWYNKLTTEQKNELTVWYQQWLDAPQTGVIPEKLEWIK